VRTLQALLTLTHTHSLTPQQELTKRSAREYSKVAKCEKIRDLTLTSKEKGSTPLRVRNGQMQVRQGRPVP
jgi:hypothetical protein